jgi:hypothetical protein
MQIFVYLIAGKTITVDVLPDDTIFLVKEKIFDKEGIDPQYQQLYFGAKYLQDDKTIKHYQILKESVIHILMRLPGGSNQFS